MQLKVGDKVKKTKTPTKHMKVGDVGTIKTLYLRSIELEEFPGTYNIGLGEFEKAEKTLRDAKEGDIIVNSTGRYRKVFGVCQGVVFVSDTTLFYDRVHELPAPLLYPFEALKDYKLVEESEVEEMTMEQLQKELGRPVKIVK